MKVVFLQDVPHLARAGEIKEVADGYGRHFLIPRKMAMLASAGAVEDAKAKLSKVSRMQAQTEAELRELAEQLKGQEVTLEVRAGGQERLYGSITAADIADALEKSSGLIVDRRKIDLDEPIRQLGSYEVNVKLGKDITATLKVTVKQQAA